MDRPREDAEAAGMLQRSGGSWCLRRRSARMIISASRRTDIPAFYSDWFFTRFARGTFAREIP